MTRPSQLTLALSLTLAANLPAHADMSMVHDALLPADAKPTCSADIGAWFLHGKIAEHGWVAAPNGFDPRFADAANNTACDFFAWGAQMFLWATNKAGKRYLFNTAPVFYAVSTEQNGERRFEADRAIMDLSIRKGKSDDQIELGQAGGGDVLISQQGSLVYYGIHANDVFAVYASGQKTGAFADVPALNSNFPATREQTLAVAEYAKRKHLKIARKSIPAMAVGLKTAWVDAATVADPSRYILAQARVPTFDRQSTPDSEWPVTGNAEKTLAMVGMHVVGTVNGHPEMIWATFEHIDNAPNLPYVYNTNSGSATAPYDANAKDWTFMRKGGEQPTTVVANATVRNAANSTQTVAITCRKDDTGHCTSKIGPVAVANLNPWGERPAPEPSGARNTTDLIALNTSVLSQLAAGDIRGNYVQTGSTWTTEGQLPSGGADPSITGSRYLANTAMETFYQFPDQQHGNGFVPRNCFGCHQQVTGNSGDKLAGFCVSHVIGPLEPLTGDGFDDSVCDASRQ